MEVAPRYKTDDNVDIVDTVDMAYTVDIVYTVGAEVVDCPTQLTLMTWICQLFHDEYQWEIWKNTAGKSARAEGDEADKTAEVAEKNEGDEEAERAEGADGAEGGEVADGTHVAAIYIVIWLEHDGIGLYDSFSDVPESRVWFASKNLTPCRMHWKDFLIGQIIAECHSFPNMYDML